MPHPDLPVMIFAAGFGTRMGALTADRPKPLVPVGGRALIDHALALCDEAGLRRIVVNSHYRADQLAAHLAPRGLLISHEPEILETGGGLRAALPLLGPGPVLVLNSDSVWTGPNPLIRLLEGWSSGMEALLLLVPRERAVGHAGTGDFLLGPDGRITRALGQPAPVYVGAQILRTEGLSAISETVFSLNRLWDAAIARGTAHGLLHDGGWCDVGRPEGIVLAEKMLAAAGTADVR